MRTNVRIGNDIKLMWQILDGGVPVNLTNATDIKVSIAQGGTPSCNKIEITTFEVTDAVNGMIAVEVQKEVITKIGYLWAVLEYMVPDSGMIDGNRKVTTDNLPVKIVGLTDEASQDSEFTVSSDIQAGFQGKSAYEVWLVENPDKTLQDYFDWLQQPATDIEQVVSSNETDRVSAEGTRQLNETARVEAEELRGSAETQRISDENTRKSNETGRVNAETLRLSAEEERGTAEGLRASSETSRNTAEGQRATAETSRATAEGLRAAAETARVNNESARQSAEELRQTNTAEAIQSANTAAQQADMAIGELTTQVNTKIGEADTKIIEMNTLMSGYDSRVVNLETGKVDKQTFADVATVKIKNLIRNGNFVNGTTYFSSIRSTLTGEDNTLTAVITEISTLSQPFVSHLLQNTTIIGNKYYITIDIQPKYNSKSRFIAGGADSGFSNPSMLMVGMQWNRKSEVLTATKADLYVHFYSNIDETGYVIGDVIKFKNWMCVDLTSTFGAGNEPTKSEMDTLIGILGVQYFEGEITLSQKQIMNWQLKMIRQNRNAIIAIGGTII